MAGVNAALTAAAGGRVRHPYTLDRADAYIGVLVDDLVDPDGGLDLLLAGRAAVLIRPDRYVFGSADEETIGELVDAAEGQVWGEAS